MMIREPTLEILRRGIPWSTPALQELQDVDTAYRISQALEEMSDFAISAVRWVQERAGVSYDEALEYVLSGTRPHT
jgi:hypothetical protein